MQSLFFSTHKLCTSLFICKIVPNHYRVKIYLLIEFNWYIYELQIEHVM
jgi:hypothetical protein